jgi:protein-tyrosine phosphatase
MIDWHSHILPGIDDGSSIPQQSLAMAAALAAAGFATVYCTPHHMRGCYDAGNDQVRQGVVDLQELLNSNNIPLTLMAGREYWLDEYLPTLLEDPLPLGDSRLILVEIPPQSNGDIVRGLLYDAVRSGFTPVIAHPERCPLLEPSIRHSGRVGIMQAITGLFTGGRRDCQQDSTDIDDTGNPLLDYLLELGCCFQGNLGSFNGFYGRHVKAVAEELRRLNVYDRYGSDLHSPEQAPMILGVSSGN